MADNKKSVLLYCDIIHTVKELTNEEAGILFKHYLSYINDLNPTPPDKLTQIVFEPIKQNLKRDLRKWESKSLKNKNNANMRWDANASERIKSDANDADKVTVIVTDNVKVKETVKVKDIFNFKTALLNYGFDEKIVSDWLIVRKNKKASNTETAFKGFISEIEQRRCNLNETLAECVKNSWSGFKWTWIDNLNNKNNGTTKGNNNSDQTSLGELAKQSREFLQQIANENNKG